MKASISSFILALAFAAGAASGPVFAQTTADTSKLSQAIEARVHQDAALAKHEVKVSVRDGVATLTGTVATNAQKLRAARLASVKGIARVDNQIVVDAPVAVRGTKGTVSSTSATTTDTGGKTKDAVKDAGVKTKEAAKDVGVATKDAAKDVGEKTKDTAKDVGEKTKDVAVKIAEKTKETAVKVVEKTKDGVAKAGSEVSDAAILSSVKAQFVGEDALKGSDINVDVDSHVVTLRGTVASTAGRARAVEIANKVDGVQRVVDRLVIAPKK